jgi:multisubunit Na+/H+ antiporter MnhF subunit
MKNGHRVDVTIISVFACVAVLAIVASVVPIPPSLRLSATIGGILLGPGSLAYRIATGSQWTECLTVGVGLNVATLMMLALLSVYARYWHPLSFELVIPLTTFLLAIILLRHKEPMDRHPEISKGRM